MGLRDIFRRNRLSRTWIYRTKGVIWRVGPAGKRNIVGEERDLEKREVKFFCLERASGHVVWEGKEFGEQWWIGIEGFVDPVLLLHGFAHPDLPGHRGLIAVDPESGERLWSHPDLVLAGVAEGLLYAEMGETVGTQRVVLDPRTGVIQRALGGEDAASGIALKGPGVADGGESAVPVPLGAIVEGDVPELISRVTDLDVTSVEAVVVGSVIAAAGIAPADRGEGEAGDHVLLAIERGTGRLLFRERLRTGVQNAAPEAFFVDRDMMFFIRERKLLTAVSLGAH